MRIVVAKMVRLSNWLLEQRSPPKDPAGLGGRLVLEGNVQSCNLMMMIQNDFYVNKCVFLYGIGQFFGGPNN